VRALWALASALSITGSPDSVTRHLRPDEVDGRGHREGVIPNGWHIFVMIARSKAAEPFPRWGLCSGDRG
jgi:hypothetical protein